MGLGSSFKKIGKSISKGVTKGVKNAVSSVTTNVINTGKSALKGDIEGVVGGLVNTATYGAISMPSTKIKNPGGDQTEQIVGTLTEEAEESKKRRRALYATSGGANGQEVETIGVFANGRGSIFGN